MSDDCAQYTDDLAELALGVLTGRERSRALSHVDACPRCSEELELLSRAADALVAVAPEAEPPLGFETRLFERLGIDATPARPRRPRRAWIPASIAAAIAALAIGLGLGLSSSSTPNQSAETTHRGGAVEAAALMENGRNVGRVAVFGGRKPWLQMTLADSGARGVVHCVVVTDKGTTHQVGTFAVSEGYGAWQAPLHVDPSTVRTAEVTSPSGTVIATATLG